MGKRKRIDPELLARWEREREEFREVMRLRAERLDAAEEREARRRERVRRLTFGLLGRA
jgi:glutamate synthase domain-containing protein 3